MSRGFVVFTERIRMSDVKSGLLRSFNENRRDVRALLGQRQVFRFYRGSWKMHISL